jgi:hypothetical protein
MEVKRKKGITIIELGNFVIRTDKINRYRYNDLKKLSKTNPKKILKILGIFKKEDKL